MKIMLICFFCLFVISLSDDAFNLPDLLVTAKNEVKLDTASRVTENLKDPWVYQSFLIEPVQAKTREKAFLGGIPLLNQQSPTYYNEARIRFALPSLLDFGLYHAGIWDKRPYVLSLDRSGGGRRYASDIEETGRFWAAINMDDTNIIDLLNLEHNLGDSRLALWGIGWSTKMQVPLAIKLKNYTSNAYAGNSAAGFFLADIAADVGPINLLDTHYPTILRGGLLSSKTNTGIDVRADLLSNPIWFGIPQTSKWNVGVWSNAGSSKFIIGLKDSMDLSIDRYPAQIWVDWSTQRPDLDPYLKADYVEMSDSVFVPDEKLTLGTKIEGLFHSNDTTSLSYTNYANLKALNDSDGDGYYNYDSFSNVGCFRATSQFRDIRFLDEYFNATLEIPVYTRDIPNQFNKWVELAWKKSIWGGDLWIKGNFWMRELGSTTGLYKGQYMDVEGAFDQTLTPDLSWGLQLKNLFANGQERMSGHILGDPTLSLQVDMVFNMSASKEKFNKWEVQSFFEINHSTERVYRKALVISAILHVLILLIILFIFYKSMNEPLTQQADKEVAFVYEQIVIDAGKEKVTHLTQKQNLSTKPELKSEAIQSTTKQPAQTKNDSKVALPENTNHMQDKTQELNPKIDPKINDGQLSKKEQVASDPSAIGGAVGDSGVNINPSGNVQMFGPIVNRSIVYSEIPEYPDWARKRGIETDVRMRIWVNANGDVTDTMIIRKSGFLRIDLIVENSLRRWKFTPLAPNVAQTKQWGEILIRFELY